MTQHPHTHTHTPPERSLRHTARPEPFAKMHPQLTIINQLIISFIIHLCAHANRGAGRTVYRKASPRCIDVTKARNNHHHHRRRRRRRATIVASWENAASALSRPRSFELRSIHLVLVVFESVGNCIITSARPNGGHSETWADTLPA